MQFSGRGPGLTLQATTRAGTALSKQRAGVPWSGLDWWITRMCLLTSGAVHFNRALAHELRLCCSVPLPLARASDVELIAFSLRREFPSKRAFSSMARV